MWFINLMSEIASHFSECKLKLLSLSQITGVDPDLQKLLSEHAINLPVSINQSDWPTLVILAFLQAHPICVRKLSDGYKCVGGLRQFKLAQSLPNSGQIEVPVIVFPTRLSVEKKASLFAAELFLPAATFRMKNRDARILNRAWANLKSSNLSGLMDFGKAMRVDSRSIAQRAPIKNDT